MNILKRGDYVALIACVVALAVLFLNYGLPGTAGTQVRISTGTKIFTQAPLSRDAIYHVPGTLGVSEIEIRDGRVRFVSSPCTGKQCVHSGWAKRGGEFIACLPNRVSVTVLGAGAGGDYYDSISF